ncbi:hypothetical protein GCM10023192_07480 [Amycolatopsis samaneae]
MGSPSVVPVPCASTAPTSFAASPASASASTISLRWARPLGAVSPLLAPSEFTAEPRTRASTRWPSRRASASRSTTSRPTPSANPVPSAAAANAFTRPSGASPRCLLNAVNMPGLPITATPPTSASEHSSRRRACEARCSETIEPEQAVSTVTAGPSSPST